ncbi:MAG TPA: Xaa-Pro peptidase family protein [Chloroflexota bacterium]
MIGEEPTLDSPTILLVGDSHSNETLYYKTHFLAGDPFFYIQTAGQEQIVVSAMEGGRARKESRVSVVRTFEDFGYQDLMRQLNDRRLAFSALLMRVIGDLNGNTVRVDQTFPALYADLLRSEGAIVEVDPNLFIDDRRRKTLDEIQAIEVAQRATEAAMARAVDLIASSRERNQMLFSGDQLLTSELLRSEMEIVLLRHGMETPHAIIAGSGPGVADPHWLGEGPIRPHESIVIDISPRGRRSRYFADMTRTVVKGDPGDTLPAMYEATSLALDAALAEIRAGADGRDAHEAVKRIYAKTGFSGEGEGPRFIHGTGHGVGLAIHEAPIIGTTSTVLCENDVVTVEPGLYDPALGGVRIEDLIVVTAAGYRNLTNFPRELQV